MRVAMVILEYHPITGGAQRQLASLAPLLRHRGVELHVVTRRAEGLDSFARIEGVPVHRLLAPGPTAAAGAIFSAAALALLRRLQPDLVHGYSLFSPSSVAVLCKRFLGVPSVVKVLRGGALGDVERLRRKPLARCRIDGLRHSIDRFIVISREIEDELDQLGVAAERRVFLPNGVDTERFKALAPPERRALRSHLRLGKAPVAVYCGRLVPEKRVDLLLETWKGVRAERPDAELLVAGDGPSGANLRRQAGDGVRFLGGVDDVAPYLQAADLFVLPSATEGLSNSLLEAMAVGLPAVATRVGGAGELIDDGRSGRLVSVDDPGALREALVSLLGNPDERCRLGRLARQRVTRDYALPSVADRLVRLYAELARTPVSERREARSRAACRDGRA